MEGLLFPFSLSSTSILFFHSVPGGGGGRGQAFTYRGSSLPGSGLSLSDLVEFPTFGVGTTLFYPEMDLPSSSIPLPLYSLSSFLLCVSLHLHTLPDRERRRSRHIFPPSTHSVPGKIYTILFSPPVVPARHRGHTGGESMPNKS